MTTKLFKEDGSVDFKLLRDETKRMTIEKKANEERQAINEHIIFLNETLTHWVWFNPDRLIRGVIQIEGLEGRSYGTKEQKAIFDYLAQHEYIKFDEIPKEKVVSLMNLLLEAMPTGKEKIAFDPEELEFYHVGEMTPSAIAAIKKMEEAERYKGVRGHLLKLFEKVFG